MKTLLNNWKAVLALFLAIAAVLVYTMVYTPKKEAYLSEKDMLNKQISALQTTIAENARYKDVQEYLPAEHEKMDASRDVLYQAFPDEIKEEDQLMYILYLQKTFAGDLAKLGFSESLYLDGGQNVLQFGEVQPVQMLSDGAVLQAMDIVLSYNATYAGFKSMVDYLATDSRVASIRYGTFEYDVLNSVLRGQLVIRLYTLDVTDRGYQVPVITNPGVGKDNLFAD